MGEHLLVKASLMRQNMVAPSVPKLCPKSLCFTKGFHAKKIAGWSKWHWEFGKRAADQNALSISWYSQSHSNRVILRTAIL